ncbi:MAG: DUF4097 family beta strand repeat-containing protein [Emticicia sp.]|nr:DUF4097 family beta strand repeat-containing protein [Emticicia sp.]
MFKIKLKWWALLFIFYSTAKAQTTLQVVTKSIEKTFSGCNMLNIEAEKADIEILTWGKSEVKVTIDLIAKHPDRKMAVNDLETLNYVATKTNSEVFLRNYLVIRDEKVKPNSNLKVKYSIRVPEEMKIMIQNNFGKIYVNGNTKRLGMKTDFCFIELDNVRGNMKLDTHYGELVCKAFSGTSVINSERSDLNFIALGGRNMISSKYGKIKIASISELESLRINAEKTEITMDKVPLRNFNFDVTSRFGKMSLPSEFSWTQNDKMERSAILNITLASKITINNSFGSITIKN